MVFDYRTDWKRPVLWGASFGVSAVLTLFILFLGIQWYTSRPKGWDADAIKGISSTVDESFDLEDNKMKGNGFRATFIIENKTATDITLPEDLRFYKREVKSQALEEIKLALIHQFVIPAHERAEVTADLEYSCRESDMDTGATRERDGKECFHDAMGDVSEFVAFDNASHIRLNLPKPVFYAGKESRPDFIPASAAIAPSHASPWDEAWACGEAKRLTPICKRQKIALEEAQAVDAGWSAVGPLPTLVRPPTDAHLEPGLETCKIMYQWDYYCRNQKTTK